MPLPRKGLPSRSTWIAESGVFNREAWMLNNCYQRETPDKWTVGSEIPMSITGRNSRCLTGGRIEGGLVPSIEDGSGSMIAVVSEAFIDYRESLLRSSATIFCRYGRNLCAVTTLQRIPEGNVLRPDLLDNIETQEGSFQPGRDYFVDEGKPAIGN